MRFKVDENLHPDVASRLRLAGHDAMTVLEQGMRGHADCDIAAVCRQESRAIVTADLDFSNIRQYPPGDYAGIIVLRLVNSCRSAVLTALERLIPMFDHHSLQSRLWIVDERRIRIRTEHPKPN